MSDLNIYDGPIVCAQPQVLLERDADIFYLPSVEVTTNVEWKDVTELYTATLFGLNDRLYGQDFLEGNALFTKTAFPRGREGDMRHLIRDRCVQFEAGALIAIEQNKIYQPMPVNFEYKCLLAGKVLKKFPEMESFGVQQLFIGLEEKAREEYTRYELDIFNRIWNSI